MRVAVTHNLPAGGARRRLEQQIRHLDADVIEVCLEDAMPVTGDPVVMRHRRFASALPRPLRPPARYLDFAQTGRAWRHLAEAVQQIGPDVIFANPCRVARAPVAVVRTGIPSVYFCDEPRPHDASAAVRDTRNGLTQPVYRWLYAAERARDRMAVTSATRVATNSRYTAGVIMARYGRAAQVLPMGVPPDFTADHKTPRHLLSVGALTAEKGHELAVRAAAAAAVRWPMLIVSPRPDPSAAAGLEALARSLGIELMIRIGISDAELADHYRCALATIYLARQEPFGLVSLEAQACGSPVIVSAEGGLPETVRDRQTGFVVPRRVEAAAEIIDLLSQPGRRTAMAAAAAEHGGAHSWSHAAAELRDLLASVAKNARKPVEPAAATG